MPAEQRGRFLWMKTTVVSWFRLPRSGFAFGSFQSSESVDFLKMCQDPQLMIKWWSFPVRQILHPFYGHITWRSQLKSIKLLFVTKLNCFTVENTSQNAFKWAQVHLLKWASDHVLLIFHLCCISVITWPPLPRALVTVFLFSCLHPVSRSE